MSTNTARGKLVALVDGSLWLESEYWPAMAEAHARRPNLTVSQAATLLERWRAEKNGVWENGR